MGSQFLFFLSWEGLVEVLQRRYFKIQLVEVVLGEISNLQIMMSVHFAPVQDKES